jgi:hypothetical protein
MAACGLHTGNGRQGGIMTRQRLQEPPDDAVIALHVDPDQRPPFLVDGLSVGGVDAFSEQRRRIREKNSGPDPVGPERNERKMAIAAGLPAARPVSAADGARALQSTPETRIQQTTTGIRWEVISPAEFDQMPAYGGQDLAPILEALARGEADRLTVQDSGRSAMTSRLRKYARGRGMELQIRRGLGCVCAKVVQA